MRRAWDAGVEVAENVPPLPQMVWKNFTAGLDMAFSVIPSIMSIGLLGLVLARYTPLFEWMGLMFVPIFELFGVSQASLGGRCSFRPS